MIPTTTWKRPRLAKNDRCEIQARRTWQKRPGIRRLKTNTAPYGQSRAGNAKAIGYIAISAKYRNIVRPAQRNTNWHGNMNKNQQRRCQTMELYYIDAKKYKTPTPPETGAKLKYDIQELRIRQEKLATWPQDHEEKEADPHQAAKKRTKDEMTHRNGSDTELN